MPNIRTPMPIQALLLALLLAPAALPADECFCVTDADDNVWFDCVSYQPPLSPRPAFHCRSVSIDERVVVRGEPQQRVAAGTAPCTPCRLLDAVRGAGIRSDEDDRPTAATPAGEPK